MRTDPTNEDRPIRRRSDSDAPITEPAPSGLFLFRDTLPAMLLQCAAVIALGAAISMLAGCGPSDVQASRAVAADLAEAQAQRDPVLVQIDRIEIQLQGERPKGISQADWDAAQRAMQVLKDRP